MADAVIVINLGEINTALNKSGKLIATASRLGLRQAAEPVRVDAGRLSLTELSGMKRAKIKPPPWSIQKIGQTVHEVYVVPKEKGKRFHRTDGDRRRADKFVKLMYGKSYEPALERNEERVRISVDNWIGRVIEGI